MVFYYCEKIYWRIKLRIEYVILITAFTMLVGFLIGIIIYKKFKHKVKNIGNLIIVDSQTNKEAPYIYLELVENIDTIYSEKYVELYIKRISHK